MVDVVIGIVRQLALSVKDSVRDAVTHPTVPRHAEGVIADKVGSVSVAGIGAV